MLPVPGPISNTESVGLMPALATIAVTTAGFLRKCCPKDVLGAIKFADAADFVLLLCWDADDALLREDSEYGADDVEDAAVGSERRIRLFFGMIIVVVIAYYL